MTRWFEDIIIDETHELGSHTFTEAEMIKFSRLYDNQYFHTDPELAKYSHFEGVIASGWHTACIGHRYMVDFLFEVERQLLDAGERPGVSGPSPGINKMLFTTPVRDGDKVSYTMTITSKRKSGTMAGWGILIVEIVAKNQRNELVYTQESAGFSKLRDFTPTLKQRLQEWAIQQPLLRKLMQRGK